MGQCARFRVIDGSDGEEALELSRHYPGRIDLLLTNVKMPKNENACSTGCQPA